jgi:hypothetical protein
MDRRLGSLDARMYSQHSGSRRIDDSINYGKDDSLLSKKNFLLFRRGTSPKITSPKSKTSRQKYNTLKPVLKANIKNSRTTEGLKQINSMSNLETEREYNRKN